MLYYGSNWGLKLYGFSCFNLFLKKIKSISYQLDFEKSKNIFFMKNFKTKITNFILNVIYFFLKIQFHAFNYFKKTMSKATSNFLESKVLTVKLKLKFLTVLKVINNRTLYSMFTLAEVHA